MAETSCVISAHSHARQAAKDVEKANFTQASEQHHQASTDFARAAKGTSDGEALRVLKLLEAQHQRLARIVKSQGVPHQEASGETSESIEESKPKNTESRTSSRLTARSSKADSTRAESKTSALASARIGSQARDSSPSLARDIATRRGIPQPANLSAASAQARARLQSPESKRKASPRVPRSVVDSQADLKRSTELRKATKADEDDGFTKFYSNLTTGTMSKLSSVLAYAGLPLTAEDAVKYDQGGSHKTGKQTVSASNDPDVKKIFSKAALEAIEDEHRQRGTLGRGFGPAESFYMVQTGGGTYSYADIARAKQQQAEEDDEEPEFVDAKEAVARPSPKKSRTSILKRGAFGKVRTPEELELENSTLKTTLEQLASRLAAFEAHAQDASMAAVEQSMMLVKPGVPSAAVPATDTAKEPHGPADEGLRERLRQLELQVEQKVEAEQKLQTTSARQAKELKKYRHWFDQLKSDAKEKDKAKMEKKETFSVGDGVTGE